MVRTSSDMLPLGTPAPDFRLCDAVSGRHVALADSPADRPLLVMFVCNHCPYVVHVRNEFMCLARDYEDRLTIIAINSNSLATHPQDGPDAMRALAIELAWPFPFLFDDTQDVARAYHAACTPDFFLFGADSRVGADLHAKPEASGNAPQEHAPGAPPGVRPLAYRGQLDGSRPGNDVPLTGIDLRAAIDALLTEREMPGNQHPSLGCNIKWTPGNEPDYFSTSR